MYTCVTCKIAHLKFIVVAADDHPQQMLEELPNHEVFVSDLEGSG